MGIVIGIMIWLIVASAIIAFFHGASGPDTVEKRDQDWEEFQEYMAKREQKKREGKKDA